MSLEFKSFTISFILHIAVGVVYYCNFHFPKPYTKAMKTVTINLVEQKENKEEVEKSKSIAEKKKIVKKEIVPKKVKKVLVIKPKPIVEKKIIKQVGKSSTKNVDSILRDKVDKKIRTNVKKRNFSQINLSVIRDKVLQKLSYPRIARKMKYTGIVELELVINTNGKLLSARVKKSSGRGVLDKAALKAANKLKSQMLPKPQSIVTVVLPVSFKLTS